MNKLKSCPFCGGAALGKFFELTKLFKVFCISEDCGVCVKGDSPVDAIEKWNKRVYHEAQFLGDW